MDPPEVHVGELPRLVARGALRLLEPRDRLLELALLHQVATDIVVRVAEVGIDLDRLETLARRLLEAPLEAQGPPEERVRLCRRVPVDGPLVELEGALGVPLHLVAIPLPPQRGRAFEELGIAHQSSVPSDRPRFATVAHLPEHPLVAAPPPPNANHREARCPRKNPRNPGGAPADRAHHDAAPACGVR